MRIRLTKILGFEMAHALPGYDGLCRHIHGHSFRLEVCVLGEPRQENLHPQNGMVMDFKLLKKLVQEAFIDKYDHALVLPTTVNAEVMQAMQTEFGRVIALPFQPTCENMIGLCVDALRPQLPAGVTLCSVRLFETSSSFAEWYAADQI